MKFTITLATLVASALASQAAVIARWTPVSTTGDPVKGLEYDNSNDTPTPDETLANLSVSVADRVNQPSIGNNGGVWPGYIANHASNPVNTAGNYDATTGGYTSFTITPDSGYEVTWSNITYALNSYGGMNDAGGYTGVVRTSLDGFASETATQTITNVGSATFDFDISGLGTTDSSVEFRIYFVNNEGGGTWADLSSTNNGLVVNGDVTAVPEPSATALIGLASLGLLMRRRR